MNHPPDLPGENGDRDARLAAYAAGEMTSAERTAFERAMQEEPELAREVKETRQALAEAREWLESDASGVERADRLTVPSLVAPRRARVLTLAPELWVHPAWKTAAAAALFAAGFFFGRGSIGPSAVSPGIARDARQSSRPAAAPTLEAKAPAATPQPPVSAAPGSTRLAALTPDQADEARAATPSVSRRVRDEDGKLIVETTLADSGVHATWIVDGSFQIAQEPRR